MKIALYPGSFDPATNGHIDICRRAARVFDRLYVVVMANNSKRCAFTETERLDMLRATLSDIPNVVVDSFGGLLTDYAAAHGVSVVVKGLRGVNDYEYETQMSIVNHLRCPELDTFFLPALASNLHISSSLVRELAAFGGDISAFVPEAIKDIVIRKLFVSDKGG